MVNTKKGLRGNVMAWSDEARAAAAAARANSLKAGASPGVATGHGHFAAAMTELMSGQQHTQALADQHGIDTSHLTVTRQPGSVTRYVSPEEHEYNRDLSLRARNGQVGSGMKFRG